MLDLKYVRDHLADIRTALTNRGTQVDIETFVDCDLQRKKILYEIEALRHQQNVASQEIAAYKQKGDPADQLIADMRRVAARIKELDRPLAENEQAMQRILMELPNIPHHSVPIGRDSTQNPVIKKVGDPPAFDFEPLAHWTLGSRLGILDFDRAAKITGARFPLYCGQGAQLERALINMMLDIQTKENAYLEVLPPFMVNETSMTNTGQLPKFKADLFKLEDWPYYLVPTAEVPVTNIHQGETLPESILPVKYTAYTPCFRSEAGSYGKDTRGLIRQHQFNKIELVKLTTPESSYDELERLLSDAESILQRLELPYQIVSLCTGDLGFSAAKTYDIEVWMPSQGVYREISSCSNFEDFQARRGNIRYKKKGKKGSLLVHTLNGSGLAVGRTFAAILENNQRADGSVQLPRALKPYVDHLNLENQ